MTLTAPASASSLPTGPVGRLKAQLDFLTPSLRRVAEYVLQNTDRVVYQTITELANSVGVGDATVTRLCRKLHYPGFHAFKIALATDLANGANPEPGEGDDIGDVASQAARQATLAIEETRRIINPEAVERVVQALAQAPRVDVIGQGNSSFAAQFLAHKFMRLGFAAVSHTDPHIAAVSAATLPPGGVLVGFTRSGSTIDTIQTLKIAAERGIYTVAITNRASSPVTRYAREVLYHASPEAPLAGGALSSLSSQILLAEVLYSALVHALPDAPEVIRTTAESVVEKKY